MSGICDDSNRQIVPRWYPFATATSMGDLQPAKLTDGPKFDSPKAFMNKIEEWAEKRTIPHAIDVVGTALIVGNYENPIVQEAAAFLLSASKDVPSLGLEIAEIYLRGQVSTPLFQPYINVDAMKHRKEIARLKHWVRKYPRNAIAWADLAFHYVLLGEKGKAEHCMDIAISIAGENRFILRSGSRCFFHLKDPEKSLFHLRRSGLINLDPWILSAEIAISEGINQKSRLVKNAKTMVEDTDFSPWSVNELAGTLSTLEARNGSWRKSRRLLHQALREPNENTMAQAEWLGSTMRQEIDRPEKQITAAFEADARFYFRIQDYRQALQSAKDWYRFQPFTSRPAIFSSYIASVCLQDDQEAISVLEKAKALLPDSFLLQNNHAFALASLNRLSEAERILSEVKEAELSEREKNIFIATKGLICFRRGSKEDGRVLYREAIAGLTRIGEFRSASIGTFFWAREEAIARSSLRDQVMKEAIHLARKYELNELLNYAKLLTEKTSRETRDLT